MQFHPIMQFHQNKAITHILKKNIAAPTFGRYKKMLPALIHNKEKKMNFPKSFIVLELQLPENCYDTDRLKNIRPKIVKYYPVHSKTNKCIKS